MSIGDAEQRLGERVRRFIQGDCPAFLTRSCEYVEAFAAAGGHSNFNAWFKVGFPPVPPRVGVKVSTGLGKSHISLEQLVSFIQRVGGPVYYFVPTHELAEEQAKAFEKLAAGRRLSAGIHRGLSQRDPDSPGDTMCCRAEDVGLLIRQGVRLADICENDKGRCPYHPESGMNPPCGYRMQFEDPPDMIFLPRQFLYHDLKELPDPTLVIIDESYWQAGLRGFDTDPVRISKHTLRNRLGGEELLEYLGQWGGEAPTFHRLWKAGITPEFCSAAVKAERAKLDDVVISPDITGAAAKRIAARLDSQSCHGLIQLWSVLRRFLNESDVRPPRLELRGGYVYVYWAERIVKRWTDAPTLILDATLSGALVRLDYSHLEMVEVSVDMPHARVRQITDKALSQSMMIPGKASPRKKGERERNVARLRDLLMVEAIRFETRGGD